ncbi:hypothetical protein [Bradyrhizobium sp. CCBAU 53415]|uniref:hypothetical protein n=1 Tax=Bradyrhizobium sp. CCBAU 53415 TaxID=1325119 RepID=UPI002305D59E|nr:hypothetical protein [Bradyrhizobium sp. CCBAU 53415]
MKDDEFDFYRNLRNPEVNPNEHPENFRPETSKQELLRMLWAADFGFKPHWIIHLRECLEGMEAAMHEVQEFRNYMNDERENVDFRKTLTPKMRKMVAAPLRDLLRFNRSWKKFDAKIDVSPFYRLAEDLEVIAGHMNKAKDRIEARRPKLRKRAKS